MNENEEAPAAGGRFRDVSWFRMAGFLVQVVTAFFLYWYCNETAKTRMAVQGQLEVIQMQLKAQESDLELHRAEYRAQNWPILEFVFPQPSEGTPKGVRPDFATHVLSRTPGAKSSSAATLNLHTDQIAKAITVVSYDQHEPTVIYLASLPDILDRTKQPSISIPTEWHRLTPKQVQQAIIQDYSACPTCIAHCLKEDGSFLAVFCKTRLGASYYMKQPYRWVGNEIERLSWSEGDLSHTTHSAPELVVPR